MLNCWCGRFSWRALPSIVALAKTVLYLAEILAGWLPELLGQDRRFKRRHEVPKPEVGEVIEIKQGDEEVVVYEDPRPVRQSTCV